LGDKIAYSINELTQILPLGRTSIYAEIAKGNLVAKKIGRRTLILSGDLERFLGNLRQSRTQPKSSEHI
jgi:hypothetical protein